MRILLTGATGYIGARLLRALRSEHDVVAVARRPPPPRLAGLADWIEHDLSATLDRAALPDQVDAVVHLAQSERYRDFPGGASDIFSINVEATFELLEYARGAGADRFLFASTGGVYGYNDEHAVETDPVHPLNFYLSSKYAAEVLIANYRQMLEAIVLRPFFVYGPGQTGMLIPTLVEKVRSGAEIAIDGDPGLTVNPLFVDDAVDAIVAALGRGRSGLFNLAGDEAITITGLVELIGTLCDTEPRVVHTDNEPGGDLLGDNTQMKEALGVTPSTKLREGLARVIAADAADRT